MRDERTSADICRANGWTPGMMIVGTEDAGTTHEITDAVLLTAVGESCILARGVAFRVPRGDWEARRFGEKPWALGYRDWRRATDAELNAIVARMTQT